MLVTTRPTGLREQLFRNHFHWVQLRPLSDEQQKQAVEQRLGDAVRTEALMQYVQHRVPLDSETGQRMTGNPLLLSMVTSIFESRSATGSMPENVIELYASVAQAMVERAERKQRGPKIGKGVRGGYVRKGVGYIRRGVGPLP